MRRRPRGEQPLGMRRAVAARRAEAVALFAQHRALRIRQQRAERMVAACARPLRHGKGLPQQPLVIVALGHVGLPWIGRP